MKKKIPIFHFAHDQRGVLNGSICSYPLQTWGWRGWVWEVGGLPFPAEQPVSVLWPDGRSGLRRVHRSCIFDTGAGGESLLIAYVSAPACVRRNLGCQRSPRGMNILSCMLLGTTLLRLWSVQSPIIMLNFHLRSHLSLSMNMAVIEGGQSR